MFEDGEPAGRSDEEKRKKRKDWLSINCVSWVFGDEVCVCKEY